MDDNARAIWRQVLQKLFHYITLFVGALVTGATSLLLSDFPWDPQAYHTSILTVFLELIKELH